MMSSFKPDMIFWKFFDEIKYSTYTEEDDDRELNQHRTLDEAAKLEFKNKQDTLKNEKIMIGNIDEIMSSSRKNEDFHDVIQQMNCDQYAVTVAANQPSVFLRQLCNIPDADDLLVEVVQEILEESEETERKKKENTRKETTNSTETKRKKIMINNRGRKCCERRGLKHISKRVEVSAVQVATIKSTAFNQERGSHSIPRSGEMLKNHDWNTGTIKKQVQPRYDNGYDIPSHDTDVLARCNENLHMKKLKPRSSSGREKKCPWSVCQHSFLVKQHLLRHIDDVHKKLKTYTCNVCEKAFSGRKHLNRHISSVHMKLQPHKCTQCNKSFAQKGNLSSHINRVHNRLKPYTCNVCEKAFSGRHDLNLHINSVHMKLRPHLCTQCNKSFGWKRNLTYHIKSVHMKLKPHVCSDCYESFSTRKSLTTHINGVHKKLKPYTCTKCEKKFSQKRHIKLHMNSVHKK